MAICISGDINIEETIQIITENFKDLKRRSNVGSKTPSPNYEY